MASGTAEEGWIDMTGGIGETFSTSNEKDELFKDSEKMKKFLIETDKHKSLIGCSTHVIEFRNFLINYMGVNYHLDSGC